MHSMTCVYSHFANTSVKFLRAFYHKDIEVYIYFQDFKMSNDPDVIRINNFKICNINMSGFSETKKPFLIGVAGGTASGKVMIIFFRFKFFARFHVSSEHIFS